MSWTDERVELLKKMWAEGKSASQIAKELGSVTRNAVIGKVHRLGLASRIAGDAEGAAEPAPAPSPAAAPVPPPSAAAPPPASSPAPASAPAATAGEGPATAARPAGGAGAQGGQGAAPVAPRPAGADQAAQVAASAAEPDADDEADDPVGSGTVVVMPNRRPIVPAGQPLPPQPAANEISPEALANVREVEKTARRLTLMELTERTCKWPIGDPATSDFWFCGLPSQAGKPYCDAHVSVAFQPMQSRRDRRR